jgi:hypothetical protein
MSTKDMKGRTNLICYALLFSLVACNRIGDLTMKMDSQKMMKQVMPAADFSEWVNEPENGLIATKELDGISYWFMYKPLAYEAMMRATNDSGLVRSEYAANLNTLRNTQYCLLKIKSTTGNNELLRFRLSGNEEYYRRLEYCSYNIQQDIKLIDGKDTLPCILHHYERAFGLAPEAVFTLVFEAKDTLYKGRQKTLFFEDNLFGNGTINLNVSEESMNNIPDLKNN